MSWQDGYQCYGTSDIEHIAGASQPDHPMLIVLAHDGDNAFGGGYSYYEQCVSNFVNQAQAEVHTCVLYVCIYTTYPTVCLAHTFLWHLKSIYMYSGTTCTHYKCNQSNGKVVTNLFGFSLIFTVYMFNVAACV